MDFEGGVVRTPLIDIWPSSVNNMGSRNCNHSNIVLPYANVYVRKNKKGKNDLGRVCGLGGFCS